MPSQGANEPADIPDNDELTGIDDIIRNFCEETVKRVAELSQSTNISVDEILEEAKLTMAPVSSRLKRSHKKTAWDVAMREGKNSIETDIVKPVAGMGYHGRAGFDGQYLKEVRKLYNDPAKRAEYERIAKEENEMEHNPSIQTLAARQKKLIKELHHLVSKLSPAGNIS